MVERADDIGTELSWQMGRPVTQSPPRSGEVSRSGHLAWSTSRQSARRRRHEPKEGFRRFIRREPLGVVLVMAPWNYPYLASVNAVVPAILAGNSVILKVASQTPLVAERYAEAFADAGLPDGVFQRCTRLTTISPG